MTPSRSPEWKNLRGTILLGGREIFAGMKLGAILSLAPHLRIEEGVLEQWPAGRRFSSIAGCQDLCKHLPRLLSLCPLQKKSKRLGFLTLYTDWKGNYWYKSEKSLLTARQETLASLESLADEKVEGFAPRDRETISRLYHAISEMLEE
jgi:hypothetical protein